jgi:serine/threonine-protein kinase RsbW
MREALNNAVIHGCGRRAEKTFTCQLMVSESAVTLEIADDGTGFDWRTVLCTGCDSTLEGGRGMPIYRLYASSVTFNDPGNCVTLKRIVEGGIDARHTDHAE